VRQTPIESFVEVGGRGRVVGLHRSRETSVNGLMFLGPRSYVRKLGWKTWDGYIAGEGGLIMGAQDSWFSIPQVLSMPQLQQRMKVKLVFNIERSQPRILHSPHQLPSTHTAPHSPTNKTLSAVKLNPANSISNFLHMSQPDGRQ